MHGRLEDESAGALGAGQRGGYVEAALREQVVEVVAGDTPRDVGVPPPDLVRVAVAQLGQPPVDLRVAGGALADVEAAPVVQQDVELVDVVRHPWAGPV